MGSKHVESFLEMMAAERGAAANTLDAYGRDLDDFGAFLGTRGLSAHEADVAALKDYVGLLFRRGLAPRTAARRLSTLRQFHRFLFAEGVRSDDPSQVIDSPRLGRPLPKYLSEAEVDALIAAARERNGVAGRRAWALVELLYAAGLRVSELVGLPYAAVARDRPLLIVRGKGAKERLVPLGDPARQAVAEWLAVRQPKASSWLFPGDGGSGHLTRSGFAKMLDELAVAAGIPPSRVSPHVLAPFLRQPSAGPWRRSAQRPAIARPCRHRHHADLYPCPRRPAESLGQPAPSAGQEERRTVSLQILRTPPTTGLVVEDGGHNSRQGDRRLRQLGRQFIKFCLFSFAAGQVLTLQPDHGPHLGRTCSGGAQRAQGCRLVALGQALAGRVGEQAMVVPAGNGQPQQGLQQPVHMGGGEQVDTAGYQIDLLQGVVDRDRQMIACRRVLAGQHDVAEQFGSRPAHRAAAASTQVSGPASAIARAMSRRSAKGAPAARRCSTALARQATAQPRIKGSVGTMRRLAGPVDFPGDLAPGAEARVDQPHLVQPGQRRP